MKDFRPKIRKEHTNSLGDVIYSINNISTGIIWISREYRDLIDGGNEVTYRVYCNGIIVDEYESLSDAREGIGELLYSLFIDYCRG